eukprot:jgi/Botrbrau1/7119/Bobra.0165s0135.2
MHVAVGNVCVCAQHEAVPHSRCMGTEREGRRNYVATSSIHPTVLTAWRLQSCHQRLGRKSIPSRPPCAIPRLTEPASSYELDNELWEILDMASDEDLEAVHDALYGRSLFSPLLKTLVSDKQPAAIMYRGRTALMHRIEERFRFLAADAVATLRGYRPTYREALGYVRDRLAIKCDSSLDTADLELEIFDHVMNPSEKEINPAVTSLSPDTTTSKRSHKARSRVPTSLAVGAAEFMPALFKLGSAVTVSRARDIALRTLALQLRQRSGLYNAALSRLCEAGVATVQRRAAVQAAQKGLIVSTARYSATSGALGILVPLMWAWLGADLALQSLGTDYGRIVPVMCMGPT